MANRFSEFGVQPKTQAFIGSKILFEDIVDKEVRVLDFKIGPSKFEKTDNCLQLQLEVDGKKRVHFSGSENLIHMIQDPRTKLPFDTIITKQDRSVIFT